MSAPFQSLLDRAEAYPDLPLICQRIAEAVENPESSFEDIARVVEADAALSHRIVKIANSSFYNYPIDVSTVPDALSVIGLQQIKNLAIALCLPRALPAKSSVPPSPFWRRSIAVGLCSRIIALDLREANTERHFLAGYLYKIGRVLLATVAPEQEQLIHQRSQNEDTHRSSIETEVLGFDSNELAAAVLGQWQLPTNVVELVRYNAKPVLARKHARGVSIVHVASFIVEALGLGDSGDRFVPDFSEAAWGYLGLDESRLPFIVDELLRQYAAVCELLLEPHPARHGA